MKSIEFEVSYDFYNPAVVLYQVVCEVFPDELIDHSSFKGAINSCNFEIKDSIPQNTTLEALDFLAHKFNSCIWWDGRLSSGPKLRIMSKYMAEIYFDKDGALLNAEERYDNERSR